MADRRKGAATKVAGTGKLSSKSPETKMSRLEAMLSRPEGAIVIGSISLENLTQMGLAKDDDVIQAFSTDRTNQPLGMPILPG